jgi:hypothetical protein
MVLPNIPGHKIIRENASSRFAHRDEHTLLITKGADNE